MARSTPPPLLDPQSALFLDFDGTLVELAESPEAIRPATQLKPMLQALEAALSGALAIISGRRLESIDAWLAPLQLRGAGLHGSQLRTQNGDAPLEPVSRQVRDLLAELLPTIRPDPRLMVENKGSTVALHFRRAPERAAECEALMRRLALAHDLDAVSGHAVIEARPRGIDKGTALRALASIDPFCGRRPVFVGDDTTDEDAIRAAQSLGGDGIRVGAGHSDARYRLVDVAAVHAWLGLSLDALTVRR